MLTKVEVGGENPLVIPLSGVTLKDSVYIKKLDGLNPPDVSPFITNYARDGGYYTGRRTEIRNLVFTMGLNPNYGVGETIPGLRELLYKAFLTPGVDGDFVKFTFYDDAREDVYTVGYTEKITNDVFDKDTTLQVSVLCPDPYFRSNDETVIVEGRSLINTTFAYPGNAETGFQATIIVMESTSSVTFECNGAKMIFARSTGTFSVGDQIMIDTNPGSLGVQMLPINGSQPISILGYMTANSVWLKLRAESNIIQTYGSDPGDLISVINEFKFVSSYWGL